MPKKQIIGKKHPLKRKYGTLDITGWRLEALEAIYVGLDKAVKEAVNELFNDKESVHVCWGAEWTNADGYGDGATSDSPKTKFVKPLTIYIVIYNAGDDDTNGEVVMSFDLHESLVDTIDMCRNDGSFAPGLRRISTALRALCNEIDDALPK